MTLEELSEILINPRAHAEKGYYTVAETARNVYREDWEFDAFHLAYTEEQIMLREKKAAETAAKAEADLKQKEQLRITQRGLFNTSWLLSDVREYLDPGLDMTKLRGLCFAGTDVIVYNDNSSAWWSGLPKGRLDSLLRGRGGDKSKIVDLLAVSVSPAHEMSYYVRFSDGCSFWSGLPDDLDDILQKESPIQLALGHIQLIKSLFMPVYIIQTAKSVQWSGLLNIHGSWFDDPAAFSLGPQGELFVRTSDDQRMFSGATSQQRKSILALEKKGHTITQISWGLNSCIFVRYQ